MLYLYGMRLRGASPGAQPPGFVDIVTDRFPIVFPRPDNFIRGAYYDVLRYDRMLTEKEIDIYSLEYLGSEEE